MALGVAALALYLPVLRDLVSVWLRVTYYSYGFLVPLFSAYLAREAWNASDGAPPRPAPAGLLVTAAGLTTLALGIAADSLSLRALSLPGVLLGLVLLTLGPAHARRLAFPIGFLVFMAPLPEGALAVGVLGGLVGSRGGRGVKRAVSGTRSRGAGGESAAIRAGREEGRGVGGAMSGPRSRRA